MPQIAANALKILEISIDGWKWLEIVLVLSTRMTRNG